MTITYEDLSDGIPELDSIHDADMVLVELGIDPAGAMRFCERITMAVLEETLPRRLRNEKVAVALMVAVLTGITGGVQAGRRAA